MTELDPKARRRALESLSRDVVAGVTENLALPVQDRRSHAAHVDALMRSKKVAFDVVLRLLSRDDLKSICSALDLDTSGREKEGIVQRILSGPPNEAVPRQATSDSTPQSVSAKGTSRRARQPLATNGGGDLGFEAKLFKAADKLRNNMDAAEYKHVVLGLVFLKYISDAFEELHTRLVGEAGAGADPESKDEYVAERVFWVPKEARWPLIQASAKQPSIGQIIR